MPIKNSKSTQIETGNSSIGINGNVNNSQINHVYSNIGNIQKRPDLTRVIEAREFGHSLMASGVHIVINEEILRDWYMAVYEWVKEVSSAMSEIDKDRGKLFETLSDVPRKDSSQYKRIINERHHADLDILAERLRILEKFIEDYMKLPL